MKVVLITLICLRKMTHWRKGCCVWYCCIKQYFVYVPCSFFRELLGELFLLLSRKCKWLIVVNLRCLFIRCSRTHSASLFGVDLKCFQFSQEQFCWEGKTPSLICYYITLTNKAQRISNSNFHKCHFVKSTQWNDCYEKFHFACKMLWPIIIIVYIKALNFIVFTVVVDTW